MHGLLDILKKEKKARRVRAKNSRWEFLCGSRKEKCFEKVILISFKQTMAQYLIKSKISFILLLLIFLFLNFNFVSAQNQNCSVDDYSIFLINGIFTQKDDAKKDQRKLEKLLNLYNNNDYIPVSLLYNPSHLGGLGDLTQTFSQMMEKPINDLDFKDILIDLHSQLKTQKLLLVGYSQGTFYANEVYNYLIENGISPRSAAVYNIATPASYVAGEGQYLTSATDKVISLARDIARTLKIKEPLPPNINIPLSSKEAADKYGGHSFQDVYLANASQRIISEIQQSLNNLQSTNSGLNITNYSNNLNNQNNGCFTKPSKDFFYWAEKTLIKALDLGSGVLSYFFDGINFTADKILNLSGFLGDKIAQFAIFGADKILDFASFLGDKTADGIRYIFSIIAQNLPHLAAMPNYIEVVGNSQNAVNVRSNENIENIDNKSIQTSLLPKVLIADNSLLNTPQDIVVVDTEILSQKIYQQTLAYINQYYFNDYDFNDNSNNKAITAAPNNQSGFFPFILIPGAPAPNITEINKNTSQTTQGPAYSSANSSANSSDSVNDNDNDNDNDNNDNNNSDNAAAATSANSAMPEIIKESEFKSKVLINEIFWQDNQWLELKNITDKEIDLNNWSLSWQGYQLTFNENDKIAPGGFFLLEYNESDIIPALRADKIFTAPLGSFGEKIILKDNAGAFVDQADFSNGWLKSQDDAQARSLQRASTAAWDLYLSDGRADNCVPQLFDKNNNIILGTPKKENNFDAALSSNPTTISQTTILQNDNFWCRRQSPYTLEFSEYAHPTIDLNASLDIEAGTEIIFKYTTPVTSAPYGFSSNERHKAFEIKGKLTARGNLDKKIKISFNSAFEFNKTYLDLLRFKETSQAELSHLDINISFDNPINFNLFNLESSSFSLKNSLLKIQNNGSWSYGVYIIRPIAPVLENNYFEGFSYPIYLWASGELQNGQNIFAAPIFKNNSGQNNKYNGITIFSGNGAATNIGNDWTLFENSPNFPYLISSSYRQPLTIFKGANLKIMPGVKIMAATCPSLYYLIEIFGTIDAQGTAEKPIIFSSACLNPQPGDWQGISLNGGSGILKNVEFSFGGALLDQFASEINQSNEMLILDNGASAELENVTFKNSAGVGLEIKDSYATIKNSTFSANKKKHLFIKNPAGKNVLLENIKIDDKDIAGVIGIDILSGSVQIKDTEIISNKSTAIRNRSPELYYPGEKTILNLENVSIKNSNIPIYQDDYDDILIITKNVTLTNNNQNGIYITLNNFNNFINKESVLQSELPYIIISQATVIDGGKIIIPEGAIFKVALGQPYPVFNIKTGGALEVNGTLEKPVYITDIRDDTVGGDTNNDGAATLPDKNYWRALKFENGSQGILKNLMIKYSSKPELEISPEASINQENVLF